MKSLLVPVCALLFAIGAPLTGADAPTAEEWSPVEAALNAGDASAPAKLTALITAHPQWADGLRTLAQIQLKQGDRANAAVNARKALALAPADASAAAVAVQALAGNGQTADAYAIADQFTGAKDPQGWVNFYAAAAALDANDRKKAGLYLALAMGRAKQQPAEFAFLDARISDQAGDLPRAEAGFQRAVATNPRLWDAWYELGVIQLRLAETGPGDRREWLAKSETCFVKVTANVPKEALGWLGLGRTQLTLGQDLLTTSEDDGKAKAREAARSLRNALELRADLRDAYLNLGVALLIGGNHQEAIGNLLKARALGVTDRNLGFNLMLAYQQAGKTAEFEAEAANVQATSVGERITLGMGFFKSGSYALAIQLLDSALPGVEGDRERSGQVHRFIGHAHAALAERAHSRIAGAEDKAVAQAEVDRELDAARDSWRKAGSFGDHSAQRFFMGQEASRSSRHGYDAGWQRLAWHSYLSLDGWMLVTGNYGGAVTGGQGLAGMWARNPLHVGIWGALIGLPLLLAIIGFCRRAPPQVDPLRERERDDSSSGDRRVAPAPQRTPAPAPARSRTAAPAPVPLAKARTPAPVPRTEEHLPAAISKPKPIQRTPAGTANPGKSETEPVSRSPEKNLTEPVAKPAARDQRRTTTEDAGAPLEKRKPKGDDNSALERKPGR